MRTYRNQPGGTVTRARDLRRNATEAEKALWRALRESFPGLKWRRQVPVGQYFADVLCFSARLVIEIDGGQHAAATDYDAIRSSFLESEGYRVLRFWNNDVLQNLDGVIARITKSLSQREREGAAQRRKGEGDATLLAHTPSPRAAAPLAPLPMGEGE
ncbi:endonuclease domain-containing protein [Sphingomonas sp. NFR15]|uniref:endonuclease domain-containing protein n=1 Tax=Sphingomonas sp. NFR15 TaxID=1566282 RepID=UPI000886DF27|nr:DUF559 domain-containing protein [Sphingomonas sp. NFR15]SDA17432.1 Very-short-patch-repair endonuclease [Sphingomonas sp. NFR15]